MRLIDRPIDKDVYYYCRKTFLFFFPCGGWNTFQLISLYRFHCIDFNRWILSIGLLLTKDQFLFCGRARQKEKDRETGLYSSKAFKIRLAGSGSRSDLYEKKMFWIDKKLIDFGCRKFISMKR